MHISQEIREKIDDFFTQINEEESNKASQRSLREGLMEEITDKVSRKLKSVADILYERQKGTNSLLKGFVKKMQTKYSDAIKEMTYADRMFQRPPDRDEIEYALFLKDD